MRTPPPVGHVHTTAVPAARPVTRPSSTRTRLLTPVESRTCPRIPPTQEGETGVEQIRACTGKHKAQVPLHERLDDTLAVTDAGGQHVPPHQRSRLLGHPIEQAMEAATDTTEGAEHQLMDKEASMGLGSAIIVRRVAWLPPVGPNII